MRKHRPGKRELLAEELVEKMKYKIEIYYVEHWRQALLTEIQALRAEVAKLGFTVTWTVRLDEVTQKPVATMALMKGVVRLHASLVP